MLLWALHPEAKKKCLLDVLLLSFINYFLDEQAKKSIPMMLRQKGKACQAVYPKVLDWILQIPKSADLFLYII
jgi:hypothetical protein